MAGPTTDVNTALIQGLLGNVPSDQEIGQLQQDKAGALSRVQAAYAAPQTPEGYSPFQDMVASYLTTMRPGWNQAGLGPAVAAPYERALQNAQLSHAEQIKGTTAELSNAQEDLKEAMALKRAGIMAGASLGRASVTAGKGKYVTRQDSAGNIYIINTQDPSDKQVIPATNAKAYTSIYEEVLKSGLANQDPLAHDKAVAAATAAIKTIPQGVTTAGTQQSPTVPIIGGTGAVTPGSAGPAAPVAGAQLSAAPLAPGSAAPAFNLDVESLPDSVQAEVERLVNRAEAQPNNLALQRNTTKRLAEISTQYAAQKPVVDAADAVGPDALPPVGAQPGGATPPSIKFMTPREKAAGTATGETQGKQGATDLMNYSQTYYANGVIKNQTDLMRKLAAVPGVPSGELAPQIQQFRNVLGSIGVPIDSNAVSAPQLFESLATNFALHQRTQNGQNMLPGAMSNYEDAMLRSMVPMLKNTPEGRNALIDFMETAATANQNVSKAAMDFARKHDNTLTPDWYTGAMQPMIDREMARMKMKYATIANQFMPKGQQ